MSDNNKEEKAKNTVPPSLSVKDLADVTSCIDVAFKRGAYSASEAEDISKIYKKIVEFVNFTIEQQNASKESEQ
jgi:hypothetical protein